VQRWGVRSSLSSRCQLSISRSLATGKPSFPRIHLRAAALSQLLTSAPSNCILIFECLDEPFSYGSCNLCIGVIAIPRASCRWRRSECSVRLPVYPRRSRDMSQTPETTYSTVELFERMQDMHRSWIERLREIRQMESDFGNRLLNAKNPMEATMVCTEWMARRLETVASEQQTFATAWLGLISNAVKSARPAATESPESSHDAS
jgi:hypothetical protein